MKIYNLHIDIYNQAIRQKVSELLRCSPHDNNPHVWTYQLKESGEDDWLDFSKIFEDLLVPNMEALNKLGITSGDISIQVIYEYDGQCALEFSALELQRISKLNISLKIECHELKSPS